MLNVGIIGFGAIAEYVIAALPAINARLDMVIVRPGRISTVRASVDNGVKVVAQLANARPDIMVDCAGHGALVQYGGAVLRAGVPLITVSIGALADQALQNELDLAARSGRTRLRLSTGAIGALDALASARCGRLDAVTYTGRKPPKGWRGSHAENVIDLANPGKAATCHFKGSARDAALLYPKNANVAAAVAIAGLGFDHTRVELISDPTIAVNIHDIHATGDFGEMSFSIMGKTLPDNTRTSALAAMSVVKMLEDESRTITF